LEGEGIVCEQDLDCLMLGSSPVRGGEHVKGTE
jgi:hypothetical protein